MQSSTHLPWRDIALVDAKYSSANDCSGSMHSSSKRVYVRKLVHDVDSQTLLRILLDVLYCPVSYHTLPSTEGGELLYCTYYNIVYFINNITSLYYTVLCYSSWLILKNLSAFLSFIFELLNTRRAFMFGPSVEAQRKVELLYETVLCSTILSFYQHITGEHTMIYPFKLYITVLVYPLVLHCTMARESPHVWTFLLFYAILVLRLFNTAHNFTLLHCSPVLCSIP